MKNTLSLMCIILLTVCLYSCQKDTYVWNPVPTCTDGIQNQGETGIDCGGPCTNVCHNNPLAHTKKYYICFLYDTTPIVYQSDTDFLSTDPGAYIIYGYATSGASAPNASISIQTIYTQSTDVISLAHTTYYFGTNGLAQFTLVQSGTVGGNTTNESLSQDSANTLTILDAYADNGKTPQGNTKVLMTGTFATKIFNSNNGTIHTITKGSFAMSFGSSD